MRREIERQIVHIVVGLVLIIGIDFRFLTWQVLAILSTLAILASLLLTHRELPLLSRMVARWGRPHERLPGQGMVFYLIGATLALLLFRRGEAMAALAILAVGDAVPVLVGLRVGSVKHPLDDEKFIEGMLVGMASGFIVAWIFVPWNQALLGAVVGMLAEGVAGRLRVDDNFLMPLAAGAAIWAVRVIF